MCAHSFWEGVFWSEKRRCEGEGSGVCFCRMLKEWLGDWLVRGLRTYLYIIKGRLGDEMGVKRKK